MLRSITARLILWITCTTAVLLSAATLYVYRVARDQSIRDSERQAAAISDAEAGQVEEAVRSIEEGARTVATILGQASDSNRELERMIRAFVEGNPHVYGAAIALNPEIRGPYAPYFYRRPGGIARADLADPAYDYPTQPWYMAAADAGEPRWSEPDVAEGNGDVLITRYTMPAFAESGSLAGVVLADITLDWLGGLIHSRDIGDAGYAMVLSRDGDVIAHPDPGVVKTTIDSLRSGRPTIDPRATAVATRMIRGERGFEPFEDPYLNASARAVFRPVRGPGWIIAVVYPDDQILAGARRLARLNLVILGVVLGVLAGVVAFVSGRVTRPLRILSASATRMATGDLEVRLPENESADEVGALTDAFRHMRDSLKEYVRDLEITTREKQRHESELKIARNIQMNLLPPDHVESRSPVAFELSASVAPARQVGGDLYDHFVLDRKLWFMVGDVSGKGVGAALLMARAITMLRSVAGPRVGPTEVLKKVNRDLCRQNPGSMYVTLFAGVLDLDSGELVYGGAGHEPPLILSGGDVRFLDVTGGPMMGMLRDAEFPEQRTSLKPGDAILLYTDGVTEAMNGSEEFFTSGRLLETVRRVSSGTPGEVIEVLLDAVHRFVGDAPQSDDITVMMVRYGLSARLPLAAQASSSG